MTEQDTPLPKALAASFGGHFFADLQERADLDRFLEQAAAMYGPTGERATAEIGPADSDEVVLEFALFDDCAYLRHGSGIAVEPAFLGRDGKAKAPVDTSLTKLINNPSDEVEVLEAGHLLCTPAWVRGVVIAYATTGEIPAVSWIEASASA